MNIDINTVIENLDSRGYQPKYFENTIEAISYIKNLIPSGAKIGFGGSVTVDELNLLAVLDTQILYHRSLLKAITPEDAFALMHTADWYISSTNAMTVKGDLINIDGRANRIAEMVFGPKNVLIVLGINKIVNNIDEGIERVRNVASPQNCVKLKRKTPCAVTGKCSFCNSPDNICRATMIQHHPTIGKNVHIVIINQILGF